MTRRDYILIAKALADTRPNCGNRTMEDQWEHDVQHMATALLNTNPRFDRARFVAACKA